MGGSSSWIPTEPRTPCRSLRPAKQIHADTEHVRSSTLISAFFQSHCELVAFHIEGRFQIRIGGYKLHVISYHVGVVRQNEAARTHQRQQLAQVVNVPF